MHYLLKSLRKLLAIAKKKEKIKITPFREESKKKDKQS